jgi:hypothetical protein
MIIMGDPNHTDPYHTVASDEGPLGVLQRILYIYHLFLSGPDRSWVQEDLTSLSFTLIKAFSRAITLSSRPELHATFLRLMDEGPSARNASDIVRIGMCIKKLQSVYDNSESIVMRDLHRHQRASTSAAVPAVSLAPPSLRHTEPTAAVPALPTPGFTRRTYFPRKTLAAASTDFDAPSNDEDSDTQDEALVAASTQAGAPKPAPMLYPSTMNVRGQTRLPSQSLPSSPPAPRPAPRPRVCFLCQSPDHWGDQCPNKGAAIEAVQAKMSRQPAALSTIMDDASAFATDYAYMSREEQEEWENGQHEHDMYDEQGFALPP